jgi:hypothetical protein
MGTDCLGAVGRSQKGTGHQSTEQSALAVKDGPPIHPLPLLIIEEIENVGAYLGGIGVPAFLPMAVDLPRNFGKPVSMLNTPLADRGMRLAKTPVGAKMDGCCHASCRQLRALDAIVAGEPLAYFRSYLHRSLPIAQV